MTSDAYCAAADRKSEYREVRTACCEGGTRVAKLGLFLVDRRFGIWRGISENETRGECTACVHRYNLRVKE